MKKTTLALALLTPFAVQAETITLKIEKPQFYGRINMSVQSAYEENFYSTQLVSNNSRVGIKGSGNLAHGLKAIYQMEYAVYPDAKGKKGDEKHSADARDTFIGIQGGFGEIKAGHFNTPFKNAEKKVDQFNDLEGDITNFLSSDQDRKKNTVQYATPSVAGLKLSTALIANNDDQSTTGGDDGISALLAYERGNWYLGYAYNNGIDGSDVESNRVVLQTKLGAVQVGALWENRDNNKTEEAWLLSAAWKVSSDLTLKAQGGQSDIKEVGGQTYSVGFDYALATNAKTFVYLTSNRADDSTADADYAGVGLEYNF